ncbi:Hypothetical_protein [Hexamita inflata]|uniref:Hypothetical_protein n=1 Tax=Hexamita inflata TaxID=28002 RepID=A0AA86REU1_9EUKA|nr:Hypothetical protein HINF_LOCUS64010 [Hexamita inflata]
MYRYLGIDINGFNVSGKNNLNNFVNIFSQLMTISLMSLCFSVVVQDNIIADWLGLFCFQKQQVKQLFSNIIILFTNYEDKIPLFQMFNFFKGLHKRMSL